MARYGEEIDEWKRKAKAVAREQARNPELLKRGREAVLRAREILKAREEAEAARQKAEREERREQERLEEENEARQASWAQERNAEIASFAGLDQREARARARAMDKREQERALANGHATVSEPEGPSVPADLTGLKFGDWLELVDRRGRLSQHVSALDDNYDDVPQIVDIYVRPQGPDGVIGFNGEEFFHDIEVDVVEHQELFRAWFEAYCVQTRQIRFAGYGAGVAGFTQWLREVDATGGLDGFCNSLQEKYDDPGQIIEIYTNGHFLEDVFFEDSDFADPKHQHLFKAWFVKQGFKLREAEPVEQNGYVETAPAPPPARSRLRKPYALRDPVPVPTKAAAIPDSFAEWLRSLHPTSLKKYLEPLEASFDHPAQLLELYAKPCDPPREGCDVDPLLFEDLKVESSEHRTLFEAWFRTQGLELQDGLPATFSAWVDSVHPDGALHQYVAALDAQYDHPAQLVELYAGSDGHLLDPAFFEDVGVEAHAHRALFEAWFAAR